MSASAYRVHALLVLAAIAVSEARAQVAVIASRPAGTPTAFGVAADRDSIAQPLSVSADGRFVAFDSRATNLVSNDAPAFGDVFVRDMQTGAIELISFVPATGAPASGESRSPVISADGRFVVFESDAPNLVPGDTNNFTDLFRYDRQTDTLVRVSVADDESQSDESSFAPSISDDGQRVAFNSSATNLVLNDTNLSNDIFVRDVGLGTTVRANLGAGASQGASGAAGRPVISGSGRYVAFESFDALHPFDAQPGTDIYRRDLQNNTTLIISVTDSAGDVSEIAGMGDLARRRPKGGTPPNAPSFAPTISQDGSRISFESQATNLQAGADTNAFADVFVRDLIASPDATLRLSLDSAGGEASGGDSTGAAISRDGMRLAFKSDATNLVAGDSNATADLFVKQFAGPIVRVNVATGGAQSTAASAFPPALANGGVTVFSSSATDLVASDTNNCIDAFIHDPVGVVTRRVNETTTALPRGADGSSFAPSLSADGRYVAFTSTARNLDPLLCEKGFEVYRYDRQTGATKRVGTGPGGTCGSEVAQPSLSDDGRFIAYQANTEGIDIYARDLTNDADVLVSVRDGTTSLPGGDSIQAAASGNLTLTSGFVAFQSDASDIVSGDGNGVRDVFVRDMSSQSVARVSVATGGAESNAPVDDRPAISNDGRWVAFNSQATSLVTGDTNAQGDVFLHDRLTSSTTRVSVRSDGTQGNGDSATPSLSADGRYIAFVSAADNLVPDDGNGQRDIFVHDRVTGETTRASVVTGGFEMPGDSHSPRISGDGRFVVFNSSGEIAAGTNDTNGEYDVYVHDRVRLATWRASVDASGVQSAFGAGRGGGISDDGSTIAFDSFATEWTTANQGYRTGNVENLFLANRAATTLIEAGDGPDPSLPNASIDVVYTVAASSGTPTGAVDVRASTGEQCTATVAAGLCPLVFTTNGARSLTVDYFGSPTHFPARALETHQVEGPGGSGLTGETPLVVPDGDAGDNAGTAVASSDEFVVMGAPDAGPSGQGEVYVFRRVDDAPPPANAKQIAGMVRAKDLVSVATLSGVGGIGDKWGSAVSISPDGATIAIGAPGPLGGSGAAHVFSRPGSNWQSDATPDASLTSGSLGDKFGSAIAVGNGGMLAVGAPAAAGGSGAAMVFNGTTPIGTLAPDAGTSDADTAFGQSLAMSGGQLVIGSPGEEIGGRPNSGAMRLYGVTASNVGAPTMVTPAGGAGIGDKFGSAVGIDGNTVVAGSPGAQSGNGAAFVFQGSGGSMTQRGMLLGGADANGSGMGTSVAIAGDYILLGAPLADVDGRTDQGRAFVFLQGDSGWANQFAAGSLTSADGNNGDGYGTSVALTRRGAVVGIPNRDFGLDADQGQADSFVLDRIFRGTFE